MESDLQHLVPVSPDYDCVDNDGALPLQETVSKETLQAQVFTGTSLRSIPNTAGYHC